MNYTITKTGNRVVNGATLKPDVHQYSIHGENGEELVTFVTSTKNDYAIKVLALYTLQTFDKI